MTLNFFFCKELQGPCFLQDLVCPQSLPSLLRLAERTMDFRPTYKNVCLGGLQDLQECTSGRILVGVLTRSCKNGMYILLSPPRKKIREFCQKSAWVRPRLVNGNLQDLVKIARPNWNLKVFSGSWLRKLIKYESLL